MLISLNIFDASFRQRGQARIRIVWGANRWMIDEDRDRVWQMMGFSQAGTIERNEWGVAWLHDFDEKSSRRAVTAMWNAPRGETDHRNVRGLARICDPSDKSFANGKLSWSVDNPYGLITGPHWPTINAFELSTRRRFVLAELDKVLDHKYMDSNYEKCAPGLRKNTPAVVEQEVWATDSSGKYIPLTTGYAAMTDAEKTAAYASAVAAGNVQKSRKYTTCGSLPGYVATLLRDTTRLGGTNGIVSKAKEHGAWVEATGKNRPRPGDIYALLDSKNTGVSHVGVILDATGNVWTTADMGQGGGWDGKKNVKRKYNCETVRLAGEILQGPGDRKLAGWLDLDRYPFPVLRPEFRYLNPDR